MNTILLHRCVPRYREALFEALYAEFGWTVVAASNFPAPRGFAVVRGERPWLRRVPFVFPDPGNLYRADVPVRKILEETEAVHVIAELSARMSSSWSLPRAVRRRRGRLIFWGHGLNLNRGFGARSWPSQAARVFCAYRASASITYSERGSRYLRCFPGLGPVFTVRNGLGVSRARLPPPPPFGRRERGTMVTIGRLTAEKRVHVLIDALKLARRTLPFLRLWIVGDGPERARLEERAGDDDSIRFFGAIHDESRIGEILQAADLAVFGGAVGLSVNHVLQYGLPVVAFARGRHGPGHGPEVDYVIEGKTGRLVSPADAGSMAEAWESVYAKGKRPAEESLESIREFVETHLTLESMLEDFARVYAFLCRARSATREGGA